MNLLLQDEPTSTTIRYSCRTLRGVRSWHYPNVTIL